jgi:hypothetical protein
MIAGTSAIRYSGRNTCECPGQSIPINHAKYEVTGFRDARFGMTETEVRAAVKKSFAVKDADIKTGANPTEGTCASGASEAREE